MNRAGDQKGADWAGIGDRGATGAEQLGSPPDVTPRVGTVVQILSAAVELGAYIALAGGVAEWVAPDRRRAPRISSALRL